MTEEERERIVMIIKKAPEIAWDIRGGELISRSDAITVIRKMK